MIARSSLPMKTLALGEPSLFPRRYRGFSGCVCSSTGKYTMLKDEFGDCTDYVGRWTDCR